MEFYVSDVRDNSIVQGPFTEHLDAQRARTHYAQCNPGTRTKIIEKYTDDELAEAKGELHRRLKAMPTWFPAMPGIDVFADNTAGYIRVYVTASQIMRDAPEYMLASRYLSRFSNPALRSDEISKLHQRLVGWQYGYGDLIVTSDSDIIYEAYANDTIGSCMSGSESWCRATHPCQVYGGDSDLHLAYIRSGTVIVARAVVNSLNNRYVSIYSAGEAAHHHMHACLADAGYTRSVNAFRGARINLIDHPTAHGAYIMAYIDGDHSHCDSTGILGGDDAYLYCQTTRGYTRP